MGVNLIITEKPSVAKDLARVLKCESKQGYYESKEYRITWCFGHLVEFCKPEVYCDSWKIWSLDTLPIIPEVFKTNVIEKTKKQFFLIKKLMNDNDVISITAATDAAREGELIYRLVYHQAGCKKPVKRLWVSSMTDEALLAGMNNLKDSKEYDNLYESARCRAIADNLVGINCTRLFTCKYNHKLTAGRVQTPTLALIVNRHNEIVNFKPEPYFQLKGDFGNFKALWHDRVGKNKLSKKAEAEAIQKKCQGKVGKIITLETKPKTMERPLLYDLTELQREANRRYGYTAKETLDVAQKLYETHKVTSYPRTDSRHITTDMIPTLKPLLESVKKSNVFGLSDQVNTLFNKGLNTDGRIVDNSKVSDHHAIIVTKNIASYDLSKLNEKEQKILKLILTRFIVTLSDKHKYDETVLEIAVESELFKASGKKVTSPGWKGVEDAILGKAEEEKGASGDDIDNQVFPDVKQGQQYKANSIELLSKKTQPKKEFTDATILTAMENASDSVEDDELKEYMKERGLGTPATRAGIIEKLIKVGYVERQKTKLIPTDNGIKFIELIPDKLKQPDLTAEWEYRLNLMANGKEHANKFIGDIKSFVTAFVSEYKGEGDKEEFNSKPEKEVIGECPRCHKRIFESDKNFYCEGFKDEPKCEFKLWKKDKFFTDKGKTITAAVAKKILKNGKAEIKKIKYKSGNGEYDAFFIMQDTGKYINWKMEFINNKK